MDTPLFNQSLEHNEQVQINAAQINCHTGNRYHICLITILRHLRNLSETNRRVGKPRPALQG